MAQLTHTTKKFRLRERETNNNKKRREEEKKRNSNCYENEKLNRSN